MPKYDYKCSVCGGQQEVERSIHSDSDSAPICCGASMERVWSNFGIHFKGGGWGGQ